MRDPEHSSIPLNSGDQDNFFRGRFGTYPGVPKRWPGLFHRPGFPAHRELPASVLSLIPYEPRGCPGSDGYAPGKKNGAHPLGGFPPELRTDGRTDAQARRCSKKARPQPQSGSPPTGRENPDLRLRLGILAYACCAKTKSLECRRVASESPSRGKGARKIS